MRRAWPAKEQEAAARAVAAWVTAFEPYKKAHTVMAYIACRGELSLEYVIRDALVSGKTLLLPRCETPGIMTARKVRSMDDLMPGTYGLLEPKRDCPVWEPERIDLIFAPGVVFDREGHRIGQGGGYYDRYLQKSSALRAGICHDFAVMDAVPCEVHDERMHFVITPGGILCPGNIR